MHLQEPNGRSSCSRLLSRLRESASRRAGGFSSTVNYLWKEEWEADREEPSWVSGFLRRTREEERDGQTPRQGRAEPGGTHLSRHVVLMLLIFHP